MFTLLITLELCTMFLIVRLLLLWKSNKWLELIDQTRQRLWGFLAEKVDQKWKDRAQNFFDNRGQLVIAIVILLFGWFMLEILRQKA